MTYINCFSQKRHKVTATDKGRWLWRLLHKIIQVQKEGGQIRSYIQWRLLTMDAKQHLFPQFIIQELPTPYGYTMYSRFVWRDARDCLTLIHVLHLPPTIPEIVGNDHCFQNLYILKRHPPQGKIEIKELGLGWLKCDRCSPRKASSLVPQF